MAEAAADLDSAVRWLDGTTSALPIKPVVVGAVERIFGSVDVFYQHLANGFSGPVYTAVGDVIAEIFGMSEDQLNEVFDTRAVLDYGMMIGQAIEQ